jgi:hypothetical protein
LESIASREDKSGRSIRMTLSLAFLAPEIVKAAVEGRLPRGFGLNAPVSGDSVVGLRGSNRDALGDAAVCRSASLCLKAHLAVGRLSGAGSARSCCGVGLSIRTARCAPVIRKQT